jgi:hypothetical protein
MVVSAAVSVAVFAKSSSEFKIDAIPLRPYMEFISEARLVNCGCLVMEDSKVRRALCTRDAAAEMPPGMSDIDVVAVAMELESATRISVRVLFAGVAVARGLSWPLAVRTRILKRGAMSVVEMLEKRMVFC